MAEELIGKTLARYKIISLLGEGGMGAVLKAHDVTLQRDVAIKIMHPHFARRPDFQERFLQEARTAARLDHPGIVKVYDFGRQDKYLYIVMEFLRGDNLRNMLQDLRAEKKWVVLPEALQIIRQVALALDYAHKQGVLHRDLKPDNIMIKPDTANGLPYRPVLTDLGLAKLASGGVVTQEGTSMGTPAYMSPEQALGQETDARSDVYSLGILLFELATSRLPFPAKTLTDAIQYHTRTDPPAPRSLRPDLPVDLEQVILKSIAKLPDERYPDAGSLAGTLEQLIKSLGSAGTEIRSSTELEGVVSLVTQYQHSLLVERGPSILAEFEAPSDRSGDLQQDRLQILAQNRTTTTVNFKKGGMSIGREPDNDVTLEDKLISRHHARIEFDGQNYRIVDLNSSNGTFLGDTRLLPGVPEPWPPDQALRLGNHWLRLLRAHPQARTGLVRPNGTIVDLSQVSKSAGQGRVGVFVEDMQLTIQPGSSVTTQIVLLNQGPVVDHFRITIQGIPPGWLTQTPPTVRLMPGEQQEISLTLRPERSSQHRAGRYPITLKVASQDAPAEAAEVRLTLTLGAFSQFSSEMFPQKIQVGQTGRITVHNQGNTQETFNLFYKDRAGELVFNPPTGVLRVQEGQSASAEFKAAPKKRRWIGGSQTHAFNAQVTSAGGESQTQAGEIVSRALIPTWAIPLLTLLCLCLAASAYMLFSSQTRQVTSATRTAEAELTLVAQIVQSTALAKTATVEFIASANQATLQALTATAQWLGGDDDVDGLTNQQELELGTLPQTRDTDQDGLSDGDEVARGTKPLVDDTDGDGLKDGVEISQGLDPLKPDTDDDGLPDNADSAPLATSTATADTAGTAQAEQAVQASQTAAAQQATQAAQNAEAATAQAAAAATAQSATQTAAAQVRVAYIYQNVPSTASEVKTLLEQNGFLVDSIDKDSILSTAFNPYKLIIIGWDTSEGGTWGTPQQLNALNGSGLPVIAMGESGYDYLGQFSLAIGAPNGWHGSGTAVAAENTGSSFWSDPFALTTSDNMELYTSGVNYAAIHLPGPIAGVTTLGRQAGDLTHYQILTQGRYMLWGFELGPEAMTGTGRRLLVNAVKFMLP
jgi:serine/threonine protein kinase